MKIVLHGFGTFPVVFRHLVETARRVAPELRWAVILPTPHHYAIMRGVIEQEDILSLQDHQASGLAPVHDTEHLRNYVGSIFTDIETEKRHLKHRPAWQQLARANEIYRLYKAFLQRTKPTHVLISQIEAYEAKMLVGLARELGIRPIVPVHVRIAGGMVFGSDAIETLPLSKTATPPLLEEARAFIARYRSAPMPALRLPNGDDRDDPRLDGFQRPLLERTLSFAHRSLARPDLFEFDTLRAGVLNNLPTLRDAVWGVRIAIAKRQCDVDQLPDLPQRFIYYPLQTTPESSINTPSPYFVDQLRAIDAIRFAMPNDHMLVVKEHPSAIPIRPVSFVRALRRRAGVVVAHYRTDSRELIKRAACTLSVTGTATLEAFILGKPSVTLGPNIVSEYLGGPCPIDQLAARLRHAIAHPPTDAAVAHALAEIFSVRYDCFFTAPGLPGEPVLRRRNIERFLAGLLDHIRRDALAA
jgi:hypothetical protein